MFTAAIDTIYARGGFVSSFSGDAFTAIFPSDSVDVVQALSAAVHLREQFKEEGQQQTRFGLFNFSVRIGLSHGFVSWGIIRHYSQNSYHFGGDAIIHSTESEQNAASGEVVIDNSVLSQILEKQNAGFTCKQKEQNFYTLLSAPVTVSSVVEKDAFVSESSLFLQRMFVPEEVLSLSGGGEFRDIVSCFISFDERSSLERGVAKVITQAHRFGGYFNKIDFSAGGGLMLVLFGAPVNPGNLFNRALNFAIAVRNIPELTVRIGLTYGTAFTGFTGSDLFSEYTALGSVVNLSARFIQKKKQAVIYLDKHIYRQTRSHYEIREQKPLAFKGFSEKIPVFRLAGKKKAARSPVSAGRLVGRDNELHRLSELIGPVQHGKFGGIVYVYGNPGTGKSRLVEELIQRHSSIRFAVMQTDSILKKPLNPFIHFFSQYFTGGQVASSDHRKAEFEKKYQKLIHQIESLSDDVLASEEKLGISMELYRVQSIIGALLGLSWDGSIFEVIDPQDRAVATELAIKEFFKALSLTEPVILFIEDIQWLDSASLAVFEILTRRIENYPLIILACSRLNDDGSRPQLRADPGVPCDSIVLRNLPVSATRELIKDRLGKKVDDELGADIHIRTEGNPFYTEQFCSYLLENGIIELQDGSFHHLLEALDIPADIYMILIARIDRLPVELKETVQIASVLGREFEVQVLSTLIELMQTSTGSEFTDIKPLIDRVEKQQIWSVLTEISYIFNHALLRDAAYDMQLRTRLRSIHKFAGDAIAKQSHHEEATYADCAFHYELADDWENARKYSTLTGEYFKESVRYDEALIYFTKAMSICRSELGEKHLDTATAYVNVGDIYSLKGNDDKALDHYLNALELRIDLLGEKHPETAELFDKIGNTHGDGGDYSKALEFALKALSIRLETLGEMHVDTAHSYNNIGTIYHDKYEDDLALEHYEKALSIRLELLGEKHEDLAETYGNIGVFYSNNKDFDTSLKFNMKALEILMEFHEEKHPSLAQSYNNIGMAYFGMGNYEPAFENLDKALVILKEVLGEKHPSTARVYNNLGTVYAGKGDLERALIHLERALAIREELLGERNHHTALSYSNIGVLHAMNGDFDAALFLHMKALSIYREVLGEKHPHTVRSYTNVGNDLRDKRNFSKALYYYEKVLDIRKDSHGDKHESVLKMLTSIASIFGLQGKHKEAEQLFKSTLCTSRDSYGNDHTGTVSCMKKFAEFYHSIGSNVEAEQIRKQLEAVENN